MVEVLNSGDVREMLSSSDWADAKASEFRELLMRRPSGKEILDFLASTFIGIGARKGVVVPREMAEAEAAKVMLALADHIEGSHPERN